MNDIAASIHQGWLCPGSSTEWRMLFLLLAGCSPGTLGTPPTHAVTLMPVCLTRTGLHLPVFDVVHLVLFSIHFVLDFPMKQPSSLLLYNYFMIDLYETENKF